MRRPQSVTTKGCSRMRVMRKPWSAPMSMPMPITIGSATPGHAHPADEIDEDDAEQRDDGADRQLDAAGDDHEGLGQREQAEEADLVGGVGEVDREQEARVDDRDDGADDEDEEEEAEVFLEHGAVFMFRSSPHCHPRESGGPGSATVRLPWTPAFAGVTIQG